VDQSKKFEFPWNILKTVILGASILDVPRLDIHTMEEATNFIQVYGFNATNPDDKEILWGFFDDAVSFIEKSLCDPRFPKIPEHLRSRESINDFRRLLLIASDRTSGTDQIYACAILRLMHVLIHLSLDPRLKYFSQAQNQILNRLDNYIYVDEIDGVTYLGNRNEGSGIKLLFFKKKDRKDREREIIKVLHKKESTVEDIYDRLGFRLVTETKFDAICAVKFLLRNNVISVPNIRPGRSRNFLVDLDRLEFEITRIHKYIQKNGEDSPYLDKLVRRLERRIGWRKQVGFINPYSSHTYRALQFTCRELVRVRNREYYLYNRLKEQLKDIHGGIAALNNVFDKPPSNPYEYIFFPYEVQIMDITAYADSIFGKSSHEEYQRKQLEAARIRVFPNQHS